MHRRVPESVENNQPSGNLVQINVLVKRQKRSPATCSEVCECLSQHQHQHPGTVEVQALAACPRENDKEIRLSKLVRSRDEQEQIHSHKYAHEDQVDVIVFDVWRWQLMRNGVLHCLFVDFGRWHEPSIYAYAEILQETAVLRQLIG
jgi:hypothetical protein